MTDPTDDSIHAAFIPPTHVDRWTRPLARFLRLEAASGVVLLLCAAVAVGLANSPYAEHYDHVLHTDVSLAFGNHSWKMSLLHLINDGLMTIFFFVVGLEIKREMVFGELREIRKAALPILGAIGGMLAPAAIYYSLQKGQSGEGGWGIPMATDIAFVVGFLAILGPRVPLGLKIFLLTLAIADDIGAILVIAIFYSKGMAPEALVAMGFALGGFALTLVFRWIGVRNIFVYCIVGAGIWIAVLQSGVHPTVAGVLLGLLTPARAWIGADALRDLLTHSCERMHASLDRQTEVAGSLLLPARESLSPLQRLEHAIHPWVAFVIMPVFALANAGVAVETSALTHPVTSAVLLGLLIGKPLGIVFISWVGVMLGIAKLPSGVTWKIMFAGGCLGGIGFTMSLFVTNLAFTDPHLLAAGKLGTFLGSISSAVVGCVVALLVLPKKAPTA